MVVDAGIEGDGVVVKRDPGMLLHTVEQFAENPNIDATLHDIVAQLYTTDRDPAGEKPDTSLEGWAPSGKELHLNFGSKNAIVDYGPREGNSPLLETDVDWARLVITQCREAGHGSSGDKTDLSDKNLSHLFSGLAIVEVTDNQVKPQPAQITLSAKKHLEGRDLNEGEFAFELREGETVVARATNGALGADGYAPVVFDEIIYEEPGEHDYEIVEVKGDVEGVTYDETVFTYHVTVSDNGTGKLEVSCTEGDAGAAVFKNVYKPVKPGDPSDPNTPPDPDDPKAPGDPDQGNSGNGPSNKPSSGFAKTNDGSMLLVGGVLAVAVVAAGAMVLAIRAKRKR